MIPSFLRPEVIPYASVEIVRETNRYLLHCHNGLTDADVTLAFTSTVSRNAAAALLTQLPEVTLCFEDVSIHG